MRLEETDKMLWILKAKLDAHLVDAQDAVVEQLFGSGDEMVGNEILGGSARLYFDKRAEISCRESALVGKIGHGG